MYQVTRDALIKNGHLELNNLPFSDEAKVEVIIIPKVNVSKMSLAKIQALTQSIQGNLSDDIIRERTPS
ncbi:MAG: hypothetical protein DRQ99_21875 [Candidatus Parabeggiatoa sp. nov. 3]|jgi:hypothetical protein|nr:MAG: hypothetical protein DRQ99_21875 [Gammaproteobacteria bacterium]